jgi:hypothetical protein
VAEVTKAAGGAPREIVARIFVIVTEDATVARTIGRRMITAYLNVHAYAEFHRWLGRGPALQPMWDAWAAGDRKGALAAIPDEVVDDLVVHGSVAECRAHIQRYVDNGITVPAPAVIPIGIDLADAVAGCRHRRGSGGGEDDRPCPAELDRAFQLGRALSWAGRKTSGQDGGAMAGTEVDFRTTSLAELTRSVRTKEVKARELTQAALDRIQRLNPTYNAFVAVDGERAWPRRTPSTPASPPAPTPGRWRGSRSGSRTCRTPSATAPPTARRCTQTTPGRRRQPFVARMRAAGCVVVGKTNTPEFGWMGNTTNSIFGPSLNPFDHSRGPGGSSGGSAAALAAGMVPLATGSDGGGSIRIPSACCGLSGMKPSLGRVPAGGPTPPGWPDLSTNGPMARRVADVVRALDVAVGPDPTDLRSLPAPRPTGWPPSTTPTSRSRSPTPPPSVTPPSTPRWPMPASAPSGCWRRWARTSSCWSPFLMTTPSVISSP